jgi:hydroxypyruvate reductase
MALRVADDDPRTVLRSLYGAALAGVDPEKAVARALARPGVARRLAGAARIGVFACGKAAAGMARAALGALGPVPALVVLPRGQGPGRLPPSARVRFASHPEPDASSTRAARQALAFFRSFGAGDALVCLISGGASSLLALPRPGVSLARKRRLVRELAASGARIEDLNRLRTSLSAIKGGRLGRATRAALVNLVMSDVPGDDPAIVGSGPTVRRRESDVVRVVASNRDGLRAASSAALAMGLSTRIETRRLTGGARAAGLRLARRALALPPGTVLMAGGETVVDRRERAPRGGRCLELALAASEALRGSRDVVLLAAGSDGVDGTSGAAGAFADGRTLTRAPLGGDESSHRDALAVFRALGELLRTGPTGTNVADWVFALRSAPRAAIPAARSGTGRGRISQS